MTYSTSWSTPAAISVFSLTTKRIYIHFYVQNHILFIWRIHFFPPYICKVDSLQCMNPVLFTAILASKQSTVLPLQPPMPVCVFCFFWPITTTCWSPELNVTLYCVSPHPQMYKANKNGNTFPETWKKSYFLGENVQLFLLFIVLLYLIAFKINTLSTLYKIAKIIPNLTL